MWYHTILSGALLIVPVAITLGIYMGIEWNKFKNYPVYPSASDGLGYTPPTGPGIQTNTYCQKSTGISPYPGRYVFNPNQWGDPDNTGALCMNITSDSSALKSTKEASAWTATWLYPQVVNGNPVHAFPNAKLQLPNTLPIQVGSISTMVLDVDWSYSVGNDNVTTTDGNALQAAQLNANIAVDMFLASDKTKAESTTDSGFEIMVWLGQYGLSARPLGWDVGPKSNVAVNGTTFDLYTGSNTFGQKVFTWLARDNATRFVGDISPLVNGLSSVSGPASSDNLGYVAFGTEAYYAARNVTFAVQRLRLDVASK